MVTSRAATLALVLSTLSLASGGRQPQDSSIQTRTPPRWTGARSVEWSDVFGTAGSDWTNRTIELADGSIVATGFVNRVDSAKDQNWDVFLRKYHPNGTVAWTRRIGDSGLDAGWAIRALDDGRLAVAGFSSSHSAGEADAYLLLTDSAGHRLSEHWYGGPKEDRATDLLVTPDGGLLLVGQTESFGAGERDVFVVRTDRNGNELWHRAYGGPGLDRGFFATVVRGGYVISGATGSEANSDYLVMKIDANGEPLWRRVVAGEKTDANHGVVVRRDGTILFAGYTESWGSSIHDVSVILLSADGDVLHHDLIGAPGDDRAQFIALAPDGTAWITGYTKSFGQGDFDILLAHVKRDGHVEPWLGAIGTTANDQGSTITVAANGDLLIGGYSSAPSNGGDQPDAFVMRVRPASVERRTTGVTVRQGPKR